MAAFDALLRDALIVTTILTLPILIVATLAGAVVAVLQAATQVQEQTLSLLPKVVVVGLAIAVAGKFGLGLCAALFEEAITHIPVLVRG